MPFLHRDYAGVDVVDPSSLLSCQGPLLPDTVLLLDIPHPGMDGRTHWLWDFTRRRVLLAPRGLIVASTVTGEWTGDGLDALMVES